MCIKVGKWNKSWRQKLLESGLRKEVNTEDYTKDINFEGVNIIQIDQWRLLFSKLC